MTFSAFAPDRSRSALLTAAHSSAFTIEVATSWSDVEATWSGLPPEAFLTPFQGADWLGSWYGTVGSRAGVDPLIVLARDTASGELALALPLVRRRHGRSSLIEFADLGVTDYNAPVLGPKLPSDAAGFARLWREVRRALPEADLLSLEKMPLEARGRVNPLAEHLAASRSTPSGNILHVPGSWEVWRRSLDRPVRKEIERSWRVFLKHEDAAFRIVEEVDAGRVLAEIARFQSARVRELGLPYLLDEPAYDRFYHELLAAGLASGRVVLTALRPARRSSRRFSASSTEEPTRWSALARRAGPGVTARPVASLSRARWRRCTAKASRASTSRSAITPTSGASAQRPFPCSKLRRRCPCEEPDRLRRGG